MKIGLGLVVLVVVAPALVMLSRSPAAVATRTTVTTSVANQSELEPATVGPVSKLDLALTSEIGDAPSSKTLNITVSLDPQLVARFDENAISTSIDEVLHGVGEAGQLRITERWPALRGFQAEANTRAIIQLNDSPLVSAVALVPAVHVSTLPMRDVRRVSGIEATNDLGYTGDHVDVAIIDTGVDAVHPDISEAIASQRCFVDACRGLAVAPDEAPHGHGTGIASVIAGAGRAGTLGAAPDVRIHVLKAFGGPDSAPQGIIDALWYVATELKEVAVLNLSFGGGSYEGYCDRYFLPAKDALDKIVENGTVIVAASGNSGQSDAMAWPACMRSTIAVASTDANGALESYSSVSSVTDVSTLGSIIVSEPGGGSGLTTGTSISAPVVSGCAASIAEANPKLDSFVFRRILRKYSDKRSNRGQLSTGFLDCADLAEGHGLRCGGRLVSVTWDIGQRAVHGNVDEVIVGGSGADVIFGYGGDDYICGERGDDTLNGGPGADRIWGHGGNDTLLGRAGDDVIVGGSGPDEIQGNRGSDLIVGGSGNDVVRGGPGDDHIVGRNGNDLLYGGQGSDVVLGSKGDDWLFGGSGDDSMLRGGSGNDRLWGQSGNDVLRGGDGRDMLYGSFGNDDLRAESGDDLVINGGSGTDGCRSGPGDDPALTNCEH